MTEANIAKLRFADHFDAIRQATAQGVEVQEFTAAGESPSSASVQQRAADCLQVPLDFPPIVQAIVPGDKVALAVDPNVPEIVDVVAGITQALLDADAVEVTAALWDEANDQTIAELEALKINGLAVCRHQSSDRETLRYLAADDLADPVYLNRAIIDADFVLPIVARRGQETLHGNDSTGVFPVFADSATRARLRDASAPKDLVKNLPKIDWLMGVQVLVEVQADADGNAATVIAGTPEAIGRQSKTGDETTGDAGTTDLVIASLDGGPQHQTWANVARAIAAAEAFASPGATIVVWSSLDEPPSASLQSILNTYVENGEADAHSKSSLDSDSASEDVSGDGFPIWDPSKQIAQSIGRVAAEHRLILRSNHLDTALIESVGFGTVETIDQLQKIVASSASVGVIRVAQFAGRSDCHLTE